MNKNDINIIKNNISAYVKANGKFPKIEDLGTWLLTQFVAIIKSDIALMKEYEEIFKECVIEHFNDAWSVKMKKIFKDAFNSNKELFLTFFEINRSNERKSSPEFNEVWLKIQQIIIDCENMLSSNIEGWKSKYGVYSSSLNDKFRKYIKTFFPAYDNIWVIVRKKETK